MDSTFADRFPLAAAAVAALPVRSCVIDGEAIACDQSGLAVFELVRHQRSGVDVVLCAFDLLELDGKDMQVCPTVMKSFRSSQESRSTRAGPMGCSIFATGRCKFLGIAPPSFRLTLIHSLLLREGYGPTSGAFHLRRDGFGNPE